MIRETPGNTFSPVLTSVLGIEETQILKTIQESPCDVLSIHYMTGIPVPCIEGKLRALVGLGLASAIPDGRFVSDGEAVLIDGT